MFLCRWFGHKWNANGWVLGRDGHSDKSLSRRCARCGLIEKTTNDVEPEDDMDFLFVRLTADRLARHIIGDVRVVPTTEQVVHAQSIIDRTGTLYRMVAGFRLANGSIAR